MADHDDLRRLLTNPRETLDLELKEWIDPKQPEGKAKIARGCLALRNNDGGRLVIGFTDAGLPATADVPPNVREVFHIDVVQDIVSAFAAESFSVDVEFVALNGQEYPIITVPPGIRSPVAAKRDLLDSTGKKPLVRDHAIYVRSLNSNNVVSSAEARKNDWAELTNRCFNNREADIGGFVRRHLAALDLGALAALVPPLSAPANKPSVKDRAVDELNNGRGRFNAAVARGHHRLPDLGFRESVVIVEGDFPIQPPTESFRERLLANAPRHTGWPPWVHLRNVPPEEGRPGVVDGGWEALVQRGSTALAFLSPHLDFWRLEPRGVFYHLRALEDDLRRGLEPGPRTQLDFLLQINRTAEVISTGLSFGRALGCDAAKTSVVFGFRWTGLARRRLTCWVEPRRLFGDEGVAAQDDYVTAVTVPLDTPPTGIGPHVETVVGGLFALFDGAEFESRVVQDIVTDALHRR